MAEEKKKPTREEIIERKISMARERGSRVLKINSPLGSIAVKLRRNCISNTASLA